MKSINDKLWADPLVDLQAIGRNPILQIDEIIDIKINKDYYLLINGLTGALDIISDNEYRSIFKTNYLPNNSDIYETMIKRGYLMTLEHYYNYIKQLDFLIDKKIQTSNTLVYIVLSSSCGMGCTYCIEGSNKPKKKEYRFNTEKVHAFIEALNTLKAEGRKMTIMLFGGEPLQPHNKTIVTQLLKEMQKNNYCLTIFSNSFFAIEFMDVLNEFRDIINCYSTTLDGNERYHDSLRRYKHSFRTTVESIEELNKRNININIRTNICKSNIRAIEWLYEFYQIKKWWNKSNMSFEITPVTFHDRADLINKQVTHSELASYFTRLTDKNKGYLNFIYYGIFGHLFYPCKELGLFEFPDELGYSMSVPRKHGCAIGGNLSFVFTPFGNINICNEESLSEYSRIGSYYPKLEISNSLSKKWLRRDVYSVKSCSRCRYRYLCGGGCIRPILKGNNCVDIKDCSIISDFENFFSIVSDKIIEKWSK